MYPIFIRGKEAEEPLRDEGSLQQRLYFKRRQEPARIRRFCIPRKWFPISQPGSPFHRDLKLRVVNLPPYALSTAPVCDVFQTVDFHLSVA